MFRLYYIDKDPQKAAEAHYDEHVVTQPLVLAKMLCKLQRRFVSGSVCDAKGLYIEVNFNNTLYHWLQGSKPAYNWTYQLFQALLVEHKFRFDKTHPCERLLEVLAKTPHKNPTTPSPEALLRAYGSSVAVHKIIKEKTKVKEKKFNQPPTEGIPAKYCRDHAQRKMKSEEAYDGSPKVSAINSFRYYYEFNPSFSGYVRTKRENPPWEQMARAIEMVYTIGVEPSIGLNARYAQPPPRLRSAPSPNPYRGTRS